MPRFPLAFFVFRAPPQYFRAMLGVLSAMSLALALKAYLSSSAADRVRVPSLLAMRPRRMVQGYMLCLRHHLQVIRIHAVRVAAFMMYIHTGRNGAVRQFVGHSVSAPPAVEPKMAIPEPSAVPGPFPAFVAGSLNNLRPVKFIIRLELTIRSLYVAFVRAKSPIFLGGPELRPARYAGYREPLPLGLVCVVVDDSDGRGDGQFRRAVVDHQPRSQGAVTDDAPRVLGPFHDAFVIAKRSEYYWCGHIKMLATLRDLAAVLPVLLRYHIELPLLETSPGIEN